MKRQIFYASALTAMLVHAVACNDDIEQQEISNPAALETTMLQLTQEEVSVLKTMDGQSPTISQDEAISIANDLLGRNSLSKSSSMVKCEVVTRHGASISKSGNLDADTLMYVLNYGNDDGYALVCADIRVPEQVFAFSETGSLDLSSGNPGLDIFMDMAQGYISANIDAIESQRDSIEEVLLDKFNEPTGDRQSRLSKTLYVVDRKTVNMHKSIATKITEKCEPLLRTYWHQDAPYNNLVPLCPIQNCSKGKHHCPAGCVAIAASQLMAYWQWPLKIDGVTMNWNSMYFNSKDLEKGFRNDPDYILRVSTLLRYVGSNVGMVYKCEASGARMGDAVSFLSRIGYNTSNVISYDETKAKNSIAKKRPVMISGFRKEAGHTWLLDGYVQETTTTTYDDMELVTYRDSNNGQTKTDTYYHTYSTNNYSYYFNCKWGWDGDRDGYYLSNVFDTRRPYEIRSSSYAMVPRTLSDGRYYEFDITISNDIYK